MGLRHMLAIPPRRCRGLSGHEAFGGRDDAARVDAEAAVEVGDRADPAEAFDAGRARAVTRHRPEPAERRRMAVEQG
jgi:hypothetical protein